MKAVASPIEATGADRDRADARPGSGPRVHGLGGPAPAAAQLVMYGPQPLDRISRSLSGLSAGLIKRLDPRTLWCKPPTVSVDPKPDDIAHDYRSRSIEQEKLSILVWMCRP